MLKVDQVMTPNPTCAQPAHTVEEAAQMMKREDVGLLPVVDEGQRLVGVLTDRDIVVNAIATGCDVRETTVVDVMTSEPVCCHLGESADGAVTLMASRQIRRVPIVDEARKVVGIISQADVATRLGNDRRTGDVVEAISQPAH